MAASDYYLNAMLNAVDATHMSLHVGDPGATGAAEYNGPDYARQAITEDPAQGGVRHVAAASLPVVFAVEEGVTPTHVGYWQSGQWLASYPIPAQTFATKGRVELEESFRRVSDG